MPGYAPGQSRASSLGDSNSYGYFVSPNESGILWGIGPALVAPTQSEDALGNDDWAAGPALIVGVQPGNWSIFGLFDNVWSIAGSGQRINELNFQYRVVHVLVDGWYLISNWTIEADWEQSGDERWTVPVGGGICRQFKLGGQQFQAYGRLGYNAV